MHDDSMRRTGDDQLVYGMTKHMSGISPNEVFGKIITANGGGNWSADGRLRAYWTVHPEPGACPACRAMEGLQYLEEPRRPHPNCKCEIRRRDMPVVNIFGTLHGFDDHELHHFSASQKITVTVINQGPFPAGARILVDRNWEHVKETGPLGIWKSGSFEFTKFGELPLYWQVELFYDFGDYSTISYNITD